MVLHFSLSPILLQEIPQIGKRISRRSSYLSEAKAESNIQASRRLLRTIWRAASSLIGWAQMHFNDQSAEKPSWWINMTSSRYCTPLRFRSRIRLSETSGCCLNASARLLALVLTEWVRPNSQCHGRGATGTSKSLNSWNVESHPNPVGFGYPIER